MIAPRIHRSIKRRTLLASGSLLLCLAVSPANAGPPRGGGSSKGSTSKGGASKGSNHGKWTQAQMDAYYGLGLMLTIMKARKPKKGKKKSDDRGWITINPGPGGGGLDQVLYLCKKKGQLPPTECTDPGARPPYPDGDFTPPCVFCDPSDKQDKYDDWLKKQTALNALSHLLTAMKKGQFWGLFGSMLSDMYDAVGLLTGPGSFAFKALKWGGGKLAGAASDAAKEAAMEAALQGIIDALGLGSDLQPSDLTTEGGLNAAIAVARGIANDANAAYREALAEWAKCRSDAAAGGKLATNTQAEADACNDAASEAATAAQQAAAAAILSWEQSKAEFDRCVEYNNNRSFETAVWQSTPC